MAESLRYTVLAALLALVTGAPSALGQTLVDFGSVELGEVRTACALVCFGSDCSGTGTVQTLMTNAPFFVRGPRVGQGDIGLCNTPGATDPVTLPVTLEPGDALIFDIDLVAVELAAQNWALEVNGSPLFDLSADVEPVFTCQPTNSALCLQDDRFKTRVHWRTDFGTRGSGQTVGGVTPDDSGLFYFFNPDNWEMLIKVLDACNPPFDRFWVFAAATTNVEYTITVVDTETQEANAYFKPSGPPAPAITDTQAFATCP